MILITVMHTFESHMATNKSSINRHIYFTILETHADQTTTQACPPQPYA
jgi:hypothetical protein